MLAVWAGGVVPRIGAISRIEEGTAQPGQDRTHHDPGRITENDQPNDLGREKR